MNLPRSSRRSTIAWLVNTVTFAVLMSAVWLSAQQRPAAAPQLSATPAEAEAAKRAPVAAGLTAANLATSGGNTVTAGSTAIDSDALRRVAYSTTVRR